MAQRPLDGSPKSLPVSQQAESLSRCALVFCRGSGGETATGSPDQVFATGQTLSLQVWRQIAVPSRDITSSPKRGYKPALLAKLAVVDDFQRVVISQERNRGLCPSLLINNCGLARRQLPTSRAKFSSQEFHRFVGSSTTPGRLELRLYFLSSCRSAE